MSKVDTTSVKPAVKPEIDSAAIKADLLSRIESHHIDFDWFLGKIKVDFSDNTGKDASATAFVRIRKDSVMWISMTGLLNIEGYRALITQDSVFVMDKQKNTISRRSVSYLQEIIKLPVDFKVLQDLIVGNPVYFPDNIVSFKNNGNTVMVLGIGEFFKHLVTLDTTSNLIMHSKLDDVDDMRNRTCDITLGNYSNIQNRQFSSYREITVTEKSKLDIRLDFKQVVFDQPLSFPFNIPKNFTSK